MNQRKSKQIRLKAKEILIEWLAQHVPEEEMKKSNITTKNILKYIPPDTHVYANRTLLLSAWSYKWFIKKIKKFKNINNLKLKDIQ
jgi:hypothetical protein|tara:strand:- start:2316 stop:2573 length:258 start_codon:yes stop_codon:yes gene_type:complete